MSLCKGDWLTPSPVDMVVVNGVELSESSSLRAPRAGLTHYGLSTSGSKVKCFARLLNHQKALELQVVHAAAERAQQELTRTPNAVKLETPPSFAEQQQHFLTHLPYAPWCSSMSVQVALGDQALHAYHLILPTPSLYLRMQIPKKPPRSPAW